MLKAVAAENRAVAAEAEADASREAFKMNRFKGVESVVFKDNPTREKVTSTTSHRTHLHPIIDL
jgi:hypothetical protein